MGEIKNPRNLAQTLSPKGDSYRETKPWWGPFAIGFIVLDAKTKCASWCAYHFSSLYLPTSWRNDDRSSWNSSNWSGNLNYFSNANGSPVIWFLDASWNSPAPTHHSKRRRWLVFEPENTEKILVIHIKCQCRLTPCFWNVNLNISRPISQHSWYY